MREKKNLEGKVALVTGGSRGIGRAIALRLAEEGADVAINYQASKEHAEEVSDAINSMGRRSCIVQANVNDFEQVIKMRDEVVKELGKIDILVNNAGITRDKSFVKMTPEMWSEVISVNLDGAFYCSKAVIDGMIERKYGRIVNISSVIGRMGNFGQANYSASKAGLIGLTKTLAKEFASKGITVNVVAPGFVGTEMVKAIPKDILDKIISQIPLGRLGEPSEVAGAVAYLVSEDGEYITGQIIDVNGGYYI
ncbi:MAG: 3-oxoacyl-[acyl-carrier-protein] reductase [Euryarchaeota archaeon]|nr:3-oxoacyl-[acyl-carrier-protein] reductase [Euryarchaeota archaeon]